MFKWAWPHLFFRVKWFHLFLSNTNNSIYNWLFICTELNIFKYCYLILRIKLNISYLFTQLNDQTVLFQTIQFSKSFVCTQFKCQIVQFDPYIGPYQVLPLQARVDMGAIAMKGYSAFSKAPASLEPDWGSLTLSAVMQSVYSTVPANWAQYEKSQFQQE